MPAEQETQVLSLGQKYSLEKEMETHSNILAWEIPWTEEPGRLQPMGSQSVRHDLVKQHQHMLIPRVTTKTRVKFCFLTERKDFSFLFSKIFIKKLIQKKVIEKKDIKQV